MQFALFTCSSARHAALSCGQLITGQKSLPVGSRFYSRLARLTCANCYEARKLIVNDDDDR